MALTRRNQRKMHPRSISGYIQIHRSHHIFGVGHFKQTCPVPASPEPNMPMRVQQDSMAASTGYLNVRFLLSIARHENMSRLKHILMAIVAELALPAPAPRIHVHFALFAGQLDQGGGVVGATRDRHHMFELRNVRGLGLYFSIHKLLQIFLILGLVLARSFAEILSRRYPNP